MSVEGDQLIYEYLTRVSDVASARLSPARRVEFINELRQRITSECKAVRFGTGGLDTTAVRRILDRIGTPEVVVAAEVRRAPASALRNTRPDPGEPVVTLVEDVPPVEPEAEPADPEPPVAPERPEPPEAGESAETDRSEPALIRAEDFVAATGRGPGPAAEPVDRARGVRTVEPGTDQDTPWSQSLRHQRRRWRELADAPGEYVSRYVTLEAAAIATLLIAPFFLGWIGWLVGILVTSTSRLWTSRDRLIGLFWSPVAVLTLYVTAWWLHVTGKFGGERLADAAIWQVAWDYFGTMPVALGMATAAAYGWRYRRL